MGKEHLRKYSKEQAIEFAEFLKNSTLSKTADHFGISYDSLKNTLNKYKLREIKRSNTNSYKYKKCDYFNNINSEEKAYFLGLMFSDGYISENAYNEYVGITLQLRDSYILNKFGKLSGIHYLTNTYKNSYKLIFHNLEMVKQLKSWGIIREKSTNEIKFPNISDEFKNAFIRGVFDGDGCITNKSSGYSMVSICCNCNGFLKSIQKILNNNGIISVINTEKRQKNNLFVLYIYKNNDRKKFKEYIYANASVFLERKFKKFMEMSR